MGKKKKKGTRSTITMRQHKLAALYVRNLTDEGVPMTKKEMATTAGYAEGAIQTAFQTPGFRRALINEMEAAGINKRAVANRLHWLINGAGEKNATATATGLKEYFKIVGAYAPTKTEETKKTLIFDGIKSDDGDYFNYLREKNKTKIIEGEIKDE